MQKIRKNRRKAYEIDIGMKISQKDASINRFYELINKSINLNKIMVQKLICMTKKELSRYEIIKDLIAGKINGTDASKQIGVTIRHTKRLKLNLNKNK